MSKDLCSSEYRAKACNTCAMGYHFNSLDHRSMIFCKHLFLCSGGCQFGKAVQMFPTSSDKCLEQQCGRDHSPSNNQKQAIVDSVLDNIAISGTMNDEDLILSKDYDGVLDEMNRKLSYNEQCRLAHTELTLDKDQIKTRVNCREPSEFFATLAPWFFLSGLIMLLTASLYAFCVTKQKYAPRRTENSTVGSPLSERSHLLKNSHSDGTFSDTTIPRE
ncbi:Oidioi.mRNA.OKI2018_I69.PAR.g11269.t1.cds [Oikopleura dioica]|uniref:Oidioi.mRNA.OKI2018_I69.PAR.g11269.t1.cds n=1 Tax=Oikopleura dioica TaxID=34765 RepID=A0ABN7RUY9_OIKDI|nr:Oidioi.mRNA.OKI2018_I69.PAR.g11269.t1.cds [Oikopleura dioica]